MPAPPAPHQPSSCPFTAFPGHTRARSAASNWEFSTTATCASSSLLIKSFPNVDARLNEPYGPKDGVLHLLNLHAAPRGLRHAMIEVRNDLIASQRGQMEWAQRLSVPLIQAAAKMQQGEKNG